MGCSASLPCVYISQLFCPTKTEPNNIPLSNEGAASVCESPEGNEQRFPNFMNNPPELVVDIGTGIRRDATENQSLIFIFGGPGSLKGLLTQELATVFDFTTINIEEIIFNYLPNKVANTISTTIEIQQLLKRDKAIISLEWILSIITTKISTSKNQRFLIDMVPELTSILKSDAYNNADVEELLRQFERRYSVLFVLNLKIENEKSLLEGKKSTKRSDDIDGKELSAELNAFLKNVDEADKGLLEKRIEAFHRSSKPFVDYFRKTRRVIDIDLKVPNNPDVIPKVRQLITNFGLAHNVDQQPRVLLFFRDESQYMKIDIDYYRLIKIRLSDVCQDKDAPLSTQIRLLKHFIKKSGQVNDNFLIILDTLSQTDYALNKQVNFYESINTYLDLFITVKNRKIQPKRREKLKLRVFSSPEGESCVFQDGLPTKLIRRITTIYWEKYSELDDNDMYTPIDTPSPQADEPITTSASNKSPKTISHPLYGNNNNLLTPGRLDGLYSANGRQRRRISHSLSSKAI